MSNGSYNQAVKDILDELNIPYLESRSDTDEIVYVPHGFLPHEIRVVDETAQLFYRLEKLTQFIGSSVFDELDKDDRGLLVAQSYPMKEYLAILRNRLMRISKLATQRTLTQQEGYNV